MSSSEKSKFNELSKSIDDSDSLETSESSDFTPVGFDGEEFKKLRDLTIGTRPKHKQNSSSEKYLDIPPQLTYEGMLSRIMDILKKSDQNNKIKLSLEVRRENKKTSVNAIDISNSLKRDPNHLIKYLLTELVTTGSINKDGRLLMKGVFLKNQIQEVLRMYIEHFVVCTSCDSTDTSIIKENKLFFLFCSACKSKKYVGNVTEGLKKKGSLKPQLRGIF
ncbi:Eukaryotic translation initiation factor 2 subunit 2 [Dictyocoela muelleri]|nr:Eukaryotic translation initiation factor 2 subunit 2 [Dictyocoela muelleri]